MEKFLFLTKEQLYGANALEIIKKIGTKAAITDFAIINGGYVSDKNYFEDSKSFRNRTGKYWITPDEEIFKKNPIVMDDGEISRISVDNRSISARLVLNFESLDFLNNLIYRKIGDGISEVEYGYYPQDSVNSHIENILGKLVSFDVLELTNNTYTTDSRKYYEYDKGFKARVLNEYKYDNRYFVRVKIDSCYCGEYFYLSNYKNYGFGDYVWIEVKPVKWIVDEKNKIMISKQLLFSGIQFSENIGSKNEFNNIDNFINNIFSKELLQHKQIVKQSDTCKYSILKELQDLKEELEYYKKENLELELDKEILNKENQLYESAYEKLKVIRKK